MQTPRRFMRYWIEIAATSKRAYTVIRYILFFASAMLVIVSHLPLQHPVPIVSEPITQICSTSLAIVLLVWIVFWLPFQHHQKLRSELENLRKTSGQGLIIHSAKYGFGGTVEDITPRIAARIRLPETPVNIQLTGCDPKPLTIKTLTVVYSFQGKQDACVVEENQLLVLPRPTAIS